MSYQNVLSYSFKYYKLNSNCLFLLFNDRPITNVVLWNLKRIEKFSITSTKSKPTHIDLVVLKLHYTWKPQTKHFEQKQFPIQQFTFFPPKPVVAVLISRATRYYQIISQRQLLQLDFYLCPTPPLIRHDPSLRAHFIMLITFVLREIRDKIMDCQMKISKYFCFV